MRDQDKADIAAVRHHRAFEYFLIRRAEPTTVVNDTDVHPNRSVLGKDVKRVPARSIDAPRPELNYDGRPRAGDHPLHAGDNNVIGSLRVDLHHCNIHRTVDQIVDLNDRHLDAAGRLTTGTPRPMITQILLVEPEVRDAVPIGRRHSDAANAILGASARWPGALEVERLGF